MPIINIGPGPVDIAIFSGVSLDFTLLLLTTNSDGTTGAPVNLTGYSAVMTFEDPCTGSVIQTLSSTLGNITLGGATGTIRVQGATALIQALPQVTKHLLRIVDSAGFDTGVIAGLFTVAQ